MAGQSAEKIRKIGEHTLNDALQIVHLIELLRAQNESGVNARLSKAGAADATTAVRNAMIAQLTLLVVRSYAEPRAGDLHCRVAAELLKSDKVAHDIFAIGNSSKLLAQFEDHWAKCIKDPRLERIKHLRDKYTAHLGEPKNIPEPEYRDLFAFGIATAQALDLLALTTRAAARSVTSKNDAANSASTFWRPWSSD